MLATTITARNLVYGKCRTQHQRKPILYHPQRNPLEFWMALLVSMHHQRRRRAYHPGYYSDTLRPSIGKLIGRLF